jgi:predicted DNA repair protein MutK
MGIGTIWVGGSILAGGVVIFATWVERVLARRDDNSAQVFSTIFYWLLITIGLIGIGFVVLHNPVSLL